MVLYYKSIKEEEHARPRFSSENRTTSQYTSRASLIDHDNHDDDNAPIKNFYRNIFDSRAELYHALLEDNYNNLSTDDKLVIMYKAMIIRNNKTNNYILLCLCVLVIIALKLFSK